MSWRVRPLTDRTPWGRLPMQLLYMSPRNRAICAAYFTGCRPVDLAREYGVTATRIHQIVQPLRVRNLQLRRLA